MSGRQQDQNKTSAIINGVRVRLLPSRGRQKPYDEGLRHVFLVGSKGIPAQYGGYETFADQLTGRRESTALRYHVARISDDNLRYLYHGAECYNVRVPQIGPARAVIYDMMALNRAIRYCRRHPEIKAPIFYVLTCRIGPVTGLLKKQIRRLGGCLYLNPDGHEWMRRKWSAPVRAYWRMSERLMVRQADLVICDSLAIEGYIRSTYGKYRPRTTYISYGADPSPSAVGDDDAAFRDFLAENGLEKGEYYLVVGRFVPENNFETILREFMRSKGTKKLAVMTTTNVPLMQKIENRLHFSTDDRIRFTGTVYDEQLLKKIRENAFAYLHGHEVGGTNPSLLEALASTRLNILLDVSFNREVARDAALYFTKKEGSLAGVFAKAESLSEETLSGYGELAKQQIRERYTWERITEQYETLFLRGNRRKPGDA